MRIKKLAAVAAMAVTMMGIGTGAQALIIDADDETDFVGAVLLGVGGFLDHETDELITDPNTPVRHLLTDEGSILDEVAEGLISGTDPVLLDDVEDALCIVVDGDTDCEDDDDDDNDGLLDGLLGGILDGDSALSAALEVGAFVGLL